MRVWNYRALLIATAVLLAAGCTSAVKVSETALSRPELTDVSVAALPAVDLAGLYIAQEEGFFARQGLDVTIRKIASSAAIISSQMAGQVDIGAGSYVPYILAEAGGARFRILAEASTLRPNTRVLVTTAGSGITTIAALAGRKVGVNGTNSIGTLLISAVLEESGISPKKVDFVTDAAGFPAMPGTLQAGAWSAAFLSEPYVTIAEETYGEKELVDLDQGAVANFPVDGYVATSAWAARYPRTVAAFVRAIEEGQALADSNRAAVEQAMNSADQLQSQVTAIMSVPDFPTGPVDEQRIQRIANAMLAYGMLSQADRTAVRQGTLISSMIGPGG